MTFPMAYNERIFHLEGGLPMRFLRLTLVFLSAFALVLGCSSEKQMEQSMESAQPTSAGSDAATTTTAYQEITLDVTGMT